MSQGEQTSLGVVSRRPTWGVYMLWFGRILSLLLLVVLRANLALAAADGQVGSLSSASSNLSLTIPEYLRVDATGESGAGISTVRPSLGRLNYKLNILANDDLSSQVYEVTLLGSGDRNSLVMVRRGYAGLLDQMDYQVEIDGESHDSFLSVKKTINFPTSFNSEHLIGRTSFQVASMNANLRIRLSNRRQVKGMGGVSGGVSGGVYGGVYGGTLKVIVSPE